MDTDSIILDKKHLKITQRHGKLRPATFRAKYLRKTLPKKAYEKVH